MGSPWASQAAIDTLLKFGPQKSVLAELAREQEEQYVGTVKGAEGAAGETVRAVKEAQPSVNAIYENAGLGAKQTGTLVGADLSKLGAAADPYKAASSVEQAGALSNLQRGRTQALTQLAQQAIQAKEGGQFAANQAGTLLRQELSKLGAKKQELAGEEGAYNVSDLEKLTHEHEDLNQRERSSIRSSGIDPNTGKPIPGGKLDKSAKSEHLTLQEQAKAASTISAIKNYASRFAQSGLSRHAIAEKLSEGRPAQHITTDPKTGQKLANAVTLPAIPAYHADVLMSAALDVAERGYIQKGTQRRLEKAGYTVSRLDLPTEEEWRKSGGPGKQLKKTVEAITSPF